MVATQERGLSAPRTSPYRGVVAVPGRDRWRAQINVKGRLHYLGSFTDEIAAAMAYDDAALLHRGDRARLNFPDGGPETDRDGLAPYTVTGLQQCAGEQLLRAIPAYGRPGTWIVWQPGIGGVCVLATATSCECGQACAHQAFVREIEQGGSAA